MRSKQPEFALVFSTLSALLTSPAFAEDAKSFIGSVDTSFSLQFLNTKPNGKKDKFHRIAVYKVLDIDKAPANMSQQIMPGDLIEIVFPCDKKKFQITPTNPLPWAETKTDGMLGVHIPNRYLKKRVNTLIETIWQIDNSENRLKVMMPKVLRVR